MVRSTNGPLDSWIGKSDMETTAQVLASNASFNPESFSNTYCEQRMLWFTFFSIYIQQTKPSSTHGAGNLNQINRSLLWFYNNEGSSMQRVHLAEVNGALWFLKIKQWKSWIFQLKCTNQLKDKTSVVLSRYLHILCCWWKISWVNHYSCRDWYDALPLFLSGKIESA